MKPGDPLPVDVATIAPSTFVGEVVMKEEIHAVPARSAWSKGCPIQVGTDMLFEQIPAYLEFFGFRVDHPRATARAVADQVPVIAQRRSKKGVA